MTIDDIDAILPHAHAGGFLGSTGGDALSLFSRSSPTPEKCAFVPGRIISDNTIPAYEITHFMRRKMWGAQATEYMILKFDMSKAYGRVELSFLEGVMKKMGLCDQFTKLIMH
jgi:hypothetical protein